MSELTFYGLVADLEKLQAAQEHMQVQLMKLARSSPGLKRDARFQQIEEQVKASLVSLEQIISEYQQRNQATEQAERDANKLAHIREGDYLRIKVMGEEETRGPVSLHPGEDHTIILVPGNKTPLPIAIQQHSILAVIRNGIEVTRFDQKAE